MVMCPTPQVLFILILSKFYTKIWWSINLEKWAEVQKCPIPRVEEDRLAELWVPLEKIDTHSHGHWSLGSILFTIFMYMYMQSAVYLVSEDERVCILFFLKLIYVDFLIYYLCVSVVDLDVLLTLIPYYFTTYCLPVSAIS